MGAREAIEYLDGYWQSVEQDRMDLALWSAERQRLQLLACIQAIHRDLDLAARV
jgi:hypothetical protein